MKLENILKVVNVLNLKGNADLEIEGIHMDSRMVKKGLCS